MVAIALPVTATLKPLAKTISMELRDALNVFRRKKDDLDVKIQTLESHYGLSITQLVFGVLGTAFGIIFFVIIPAALMAGRAADVFFWNTLVFVCLTIGMIQIMRLCLAPTAEVFAGLITKGFCCISGLKRLRPVI